MLQFDYAALFAIISILKESSKSRTGNILHTHFSKPKASLTIHISQNQRESLAYQWGSYYLSRSFLGGTILRVWYK